MDKRKILIILATIVILVGAGFVVKTFFLDRQQNAVSALRVDSYPAATIFLNDKQVGQTPFSNEKMTAGDYKLKLVVTGVPGTFSTYETKIKLTPESLTYVSRDIGKDEDSSGGQILWLEKLSSDKNAEVAVVSDPDFGLVKVDGEDKGKTSIIIKDLPPGDHEISVSLQGYSDQVIKARVIGGFRLNAAVKLANTNSVDTTQPTLSPTPMATISGKLSPTPVATSSGQTFPKPYVLIKETGVGFLRVRSAPATSASESARVKPGEKYPLLSEVSGWAQIKLATLSGWVSDQYVSKVK